MTIYTLTRKNGSFPLNLRLYHDSYDSARNELRRYARKMVGGWGHAQHVPLAAVSLFNVRISKKEV